MQRNNARNWASIRADAVAGRFKTIPDDVFVRHYAALKRISEFILSLYDRLKNFPL